jgi:hypothetical protein
MLYRQIIAVCSQIHTKHINTLCGQTVELLSVERGGGSPSVNMKFAAGYDPPHCHLSPS